MFWAAAFSTVEGEFIKKMDQIKKVNVSAYDHLDARDPHTWCRAFFRSGLACEAVEMA